MSLKHRISQFFYKKYNNTFSQFGEDTILASLFPGVKKGFYVDIGAFRPIRFSNTFIFYRRGWSGINIDAAPGCMDEFNKVRPRDINVEAAVSDREEMLTYYYLGKDSSMNSFSKDFLEEHGFMSSVKKTIEISTQRLDVILDKYAPDAKIDFLSIDIEGLEIKALNSNNWLKYQPKVIILESFDRMNDEGSFDLPVREYLKGKGYNLICKSTSFIIFLKEGETVGHQN